MDPFAAAVTNQFDNRWFAYCQRWCKKVVGQTPGRQPLISRSWPVTDVRSHAKTKRTNSDERPIEQYGHPKKKRVNNPPVGLVTPETDQDETKRTYAYDPHLDPTLQLSFFLKE